MIIPKFRRGCGLCVCVFYVLSYLFVSAAIGTVVFVSVLLFSWVCAP